MSRQRATPEWDSVSPAREAASQTTSSSDDGYVNLSKSSGPTVSALLRMSSFWSQLDDDGQLSVTAKNALKLYGSIREQSFEEQVERLDRSGADKTTIAEIFRVEIIFNDLLLIEQKVGSEVCELVEKLNDGSFRPAWIKLKADYWLRRHFPAVHRILLQEWRERTFERYQKSDDDLVVPTSR